MKCKGIYHSKTNRLELLYGKRHISFIDIKPNCWVQFYDGTNLKDLQFDNEGCWIYDVVYEDEGFCTITDYGEEVRLIVL